jgi:hypothetical protein
VQRVKDFFGEIDQKWSPDSSEKVRLRIIGCGALMLQTNYERGTKDSDVFDTIELAAKTKEQLLRLAGPNTELANRRLMYVDIVANGIPFLPSNCPLNRGKPRDRPTWVFECRTTQPFVASPGPHAIVHGVCATPR